MTTSTSSDDDALRSADRTFRAVVSDIVEEPLREVLRKVEVETGSVRDDLRRDRRQLAGRIDDAFGQLTLPDLLQHVQALEDRVDEVRAEQKNEASSARTQLEDALADIASRVDTIAATQRSDAARQAESATVVCARVESLVRQVVILRWLIIAILVVSICVVTGIVVTAL